MSSGRIRIFCLKIHQNERIQDNDSPNQTTKHIGSEMNIMKQQEEAKDAKNPLTG